MKNKKICSTMVFLVATMIVATYLLPTIYALTFESDYDYDEGVTGSWAEAYVEGWRGELLYYDIYHEDNYDFAQGYWGTTDKTWKPEGQYEDGKYGVTRRQLWVWQDDDFIEHLDAYAYIGQIS